MSAAARKTGAARARELIDRLYGEEFETYAADWRADFAALWQRYLRPYATSFAAGAAATVLWSSMPYLFAMTWRYLVDTVLAVGGTLTDAEREANVRGVILFFALNCAIWTGAMFCQQTRGWIVNTTSRKLVYNLRKDLHSKLAELHIGFFDRTPVGRLMSRVMDDVSVIQETATAILMYLPGPLIKFVMGPALMLYLNWKLAAFVILMMPVYGLAFARMRPLIRRTHIALRRLNSRMYALAAERVAGIRVVQTFGREKSEERSLAAIMHDHLRVAMRNVVYEQGLGMATLLVTAVTTAAIVYTCAEGVRQGTMTIGDLVAFISAMAATFAPVGELFGHLVQAQATLVVVRRVLALLDERVETPSGRISMDGMKGKVSLDRVTFTYPGQTRPAISGVTFDVRPGERVALVGPSGSGKSTLLQLLLRFYDPQEGVVAVGGVNVKDADLNSLYRHMRLVQQEPVVFSGSIAENVAYGDYDAPIHDVVAAGQAAELHEFIATLPAGYKTQVGENGIMLSGGERQRLALATALLTRPDILLLDDITSALDAGTEARIRHTLKRILAGRTAIITTQRIAMARDCDRILVLDEGRIVNSGTHDQLIAQPGFYRTIHEQQA